MAIVYTSMTPLASTTLGGTLHTVTGTGLNTVLNVLVKNVPAQIVGTPSNTTLVFRAPAVAAAGAAQVRLLDASTEVTATDPITYTAVTTPEALISQSPAHFRLDVRPLGSTNPRLPVRGMTDFKAPFDITTVDDSDYQSGFFGSDAKVQGKWSIQATVKRGLGAISGAYDPGQEVIRLSEDRVGAAGVLDCMWYDLNGGPEAYQGLAISKWAANGGPKASLENVAITLNGQGARNLITNPVLADPTLTVY
jgi:IPT/TIG domain-containing protein